MHFKCSISLDYLLKRLSFIRWISFAPLPKIKGLYLWGGVVSKFYILCYQSIGLFLCHISLSCLLKYNSQFIKFASLKCIVKSFLLSIWSLRKAQGVGEVVRGVKLPNCNKSAYNFTSAFYSCRFHACVFNQLGILLLCCIYHWKQFLSKWTCTTQTHAVQGSTWFTKFCNQRKYLIPVHFRCPPKKPYIYSVATYSWLHCKSWQNPMGKPWKTLIYLLSLEIWLICSLHKNWALQISVLHLEFCVYLLLLSIIVSRFNHVVECILI